MIRASAHRERETHVRILHARFIRNVPTITPFICLQKSNSQPFRNKTGGESMIGIYIKGGSTFHESKLGLRTTLSSALRQELSAPKTNLLRI